MPLGRSLRQGIGTLWRGVLSAASKGQSALVTVTRIGRRMEQAGVPVPDNLAQQVDQFTGIANSIIEARLNTSIALDSDTIKPSMIAREPYSMPPEQFATSPAYHLRIGIKVEGQPETVYRTVTGIQVLPATVGELRDLAIANAHAMSVGTVPGGGLGGAVTGLANVAIAVAPSGLPRSTP